MHQMHQMIYQVFNATPAAMFRIPRHPAQTAARNDDGVSRQVFHLERMRQLCP
jgi:hypothetical protein